MRHDRETADMFAFSSTMAVYSVFYSSVSKCVLLTLLVASCAAREICDKSKCPGPLRYYKEIECKPVYKNPGDCCAETFDCSHLEKLSRNKCYVNGHEYSIGENLRDEDAGPCDMFCKCVKGYPFSEDRTAQFNCVEVDCVFPPWKKDCFNKRTDDTVCCGFTQVCLTEEQKRVTCEVDGEVYHDGHGFSPKSDRDLVCTCMPGYTGQNVEPFCKKKTPRYYCGLLFRNADAIHNKCAPVFYSYQDVQKECNYQSRCPTDDDTVVHNHDGKSLSETDESKVCTFGNMKMHIGDTLKEGNTFETKCIKCKCEVPPFPTCIQEQNCTTVTHFVG
ncbi:uncharacterized protein LOC143208902 isoform X2 [Lasioglossum baleicum]|uniref:uncharacterized protein LOC143208902 isoform X2 n=1 Tax=Lasioglossum baleicum TaxID=434251 RepID=UPI003FCC50C5